MAKKNLTYQFKNATISLEENEIVEYDKDENAEIHTLSDFIKLLEGEGRRFDITFKEATELAPTEREGL